MDLVTDLVTYLVTFLVTFSTENNHELMRRFMIFERHIRVISVAPTACYVYLVFHECKNKKLISIIQNFFVPLHPKHQEQSSSDGLANRA